MRQVRPSRLGVGLLVAAVAFQLPYTTDFSTPENTLSERGAWRQVQDRTNFAVEDGVCYGLQEGGLYDDSIQVLNIAPIADVEIITDVELGAVNGVAELEHIHRCDPITGAYYEVNFARDGSYCDFIYALGGGIDLGDYDYLIPTGSFSIPGGINNGDRLRTRMVGNTITAWVDHGLGSGWQLIGSASDTRNGGNAALSTGRPGIGAFVKSNNPGVDGPLRNYAFRNFVAMAA
jgi:hypothetical protein